MREELQQFREQVTSDDQQGLMSEEDFARKLRQMEERKARKAQRKSEKDKSEKTAAARLNAAISQKSAPADTSINPGNTVRIKGLGTIGKVESVSGKQAVVIFGDVKTKVKVEQLERCAPMEKEKGEMKNAVDKHAHLAIQTSRMTRSTIEDRKHNFHQDLDVRGMRGDEAVDTVMHFIDDAILMGMSRVRILHGTGSGILRQLIRQYLATVPNVKKAKDEHVQFGGAGITVVDLD